MKLYQKSIIVALFMGLFWVQSCKKEETPTPPEELTPETPTSLEAIPKSAEQIQITWVDNSDNEATFSIERSEGDNKNFTKIATVNQDNVSYEDTKLTPNTLYFYRVQAVTSVDVKSEYSNETSAQTEVNLDKPMGLRGEAISAFEIQLIWLDNNEKETAYKVERSVNDESNYEEIAILDSDITNYKDTDVKEVTKYFYRIQAINLIGVSEYSDVTVVETPVDIPDTPINLRAVPISITEIDLEWDDVSDNETGFELERATESPENFELVRRTSENITTYSDSKLQPATIYYYRVRAIKDDVLSPYSDIIKAQTNLRPPTAPKSLDGEPTSETSAKLTWSDESDNEAGFRVFRRIGFSGDFTQISELRTNITEFEDKDLEPATRYYYRIQAFNSGGVSDFTQNELVITPDFPPVAPSNLVTTASSGSGIDIEWRNNADNVDNFVIERSEDNVTFEEIATVLSTTVKTFIGRLTPNTTYYFRVKAINEAGASSYSNVATVTTLQVIPTKPNMSQVVTISGSKLNVIWRDESTNEDGFIIYRSSASSLTYTELVRVGENITEYTDTNLEPSTLYYYKLKSFNSAGESELSNSGSGKTSDGKPVTPILLGLEALALGKVAVNFEEKSLDATKIILEVSEDNPSNFVEYVDFEATGGTQTQNVGNFKGNTLYFFRLKAINGDLSSGYSQILSITTGDAPPIAPSALEVRATSSTSMRLTWTDNSEDETGFKLERSLNGSSFVQLATLDKNVTLYIDNGLIDNVTYFYRLKSYNAVGDSEYTDLVSAETPIQGAPLAPSELVLTSSDNPLKINISWQDNSLNETGFRIERRTVSGSYQVIATLGANIRSYSDLNVSGNTQYYYRIKAFNNTADSPVSSEKSTVITAVPSSPFNVSGQYSQSPHTVKLSWAMLNYEIIKSNGVLSGFKIERSEATNQNFTVIKTVDENTLEYSDTDLKDGTIYYYRVKAYNDKGDSNASSEWAVQTQ